MVLYWQGDFQHRTAVTGLFNAVSQSRELLEQVHARSSNQRMKFEWWTMPMPSVS